MDDELKKDEKLPLVSVCIPAYNHQKYVLESLQSVIVQDYKNIELIIINDGSKDKTDEVIKSYEQQCRERFVRFEYRNRENRGISTTLNEMVDWSKGKYFTVIASDDVMLPFKISLLVEELEMLDANYVVAFGDAIFVDDNSKEVYLDKKSGQYTSKEKGIKFFLEYYTEEKQIDYKDKETFGSYKTLLSGNYLPAMSYVAKLDKIKEVNAWTSGNTIEDLEMWLKLSKKYKFAYVDKAVALYRLHDNNTCKLMKYELVRDSICLLESDKKFIFEKGFSDIFYVTISDLILQLRKYDSKLFIKYLIRYLFQPKFVYSIISKLANKFIRY